MAGGEKNGGVTRWLTPAAILLAWAVSLYGAVWWASGDRASALSQIQAQEAAMGEQRKTLDDHEARLRVLQERQVEMATNVAWIRNRLENRGPPVAQSLLPAP